MSNSNVFNFLGIDSVEDDNLLLKKIHLKRFKSNLPNYVVEFCKTKYMETNDIRFFNELLWLIGKDFNYLKEAVQKFESNYENLKYQCSLYEGMICSDSFMTNPVIDKSVLKSTSVALIGNPIHFIIPFYYFLINGKKVDVINVQYHPNKTLNKFLSSTLVNYLFKMIFMNSYKEVLINNKSDLKSFKLPKKYDVGFHKLSFIIRENVISSFNKGLINDHWGELPFLKGRSTLLYSKLFGIEPIITNHLIDKDIDSGKIICYTSLKNKNKKLNIFFGLYKRIYKSILLLSSNIFKEIDNKQGVIFYEMHPWIINKLQ